MSTTITSSLGSTIVTSYAWLGAANASPSVQNVGGYERRRNLAPNPLNGASLAGLTLARVTLSLGADFVRATITDAAAGSGSQRIQVGAFSATEYAIPVTPGTPVNFSAEVRSSTGQTMSVQAFFFNEAGSFTGTTSALQELPGSATNFVRVTGTVTPPSTAARVSFYFGTGSGSRAVGDTFDVRRVFVGDLGTYFDGSTPSSSETKGDTTSPLLMLGFETSRRSQSIFHDVIGGGQDVTLRAAALRSGTLRFLYADEAAATQAVTALTRPALFYVADTDRPTVTMYFAVDGQVTLKLDDGRSLWLVDVGYREVTP